MSEESGWLCDECRKAVGKKPAKKANCVQLPKGLKRVIDDYYEMTDYIINVGGEMLKNAIVEGEEFECPEGMDEAIVAYLEEEELSEKSIRKEAKQESAKAKKMAKAKSTKNKH